MTETSWHEELRAKGYRVTPQRQLVLEAVKALEHATPEEICAKVRLTARGVNISTVYRTLELLEELGMVTHTHLGHGAPTSPPPAVGQRRARAPDGWPGRRPGALGWVGCTATARLPPTGGTGVRSLLVRSGAAGRSGGG